MIAVKATVIGGDIACDGCSVVGLERLEEVSQLFLEEGRYYSTPLKGFIELLTSGFLDGLANFAGCGFGYWCLPTTLQSVFKEDPNS